MATVAAFIGGVLGASGAAATALGATVMVSGGLALGSMAMQHKAGRDATKAQKKQLRASQRISKIKERKARVRQLRQERVQRAMAVKRASTGYGGVSAIRGASGLQGALGSLSSQRASNLGMMSAVSREQDVMASATSDMYSAQREGSMWGAVGNVAGSIFDTVGGARGIMGAFGGPKPLQYNFNYGLSR